VSPYTRTTRRGRERPRRYQAVQWPMVVWLTLVWWVLWGTFTPLSLVGGVLVGVLACAVLPLPPLRIGARPRPLALLALVGRFLLDVVLASLQVARVTLFPPRPLRNALVAVRLRSQSDIVLTAVAEIVSLVPGTVVVEAHRSSHTLYLHTIDVPDEAAVERARERVLDQERRLVRAFGGLDQDGPPLGARGLRRVARRASFDEEEGS
jgi:multicomponent Na+:H+ antiporter subunit E